MASASLRASVLVVEADAAERERRARQQVDVPVDRDDLHLRTDEGEELRDEEPPVVAMPESEVRSAGHEKTRSQE
jgi:hypothetical protein